MNNKWSKAIVGALFGAAGGLFLISNFKSGNFKHVITFFAAIVGYLVCIFLTIIIHESGHLVMGLLTGYRFSSFRISSFLLQKDNGKLKLRRFDIPDKCVNSFDFMMYYIGCAHLLEKLDFAGAADMLGFIADNYNSKDVMNNEIMCEYSFCRMALEADKSEIDGLYNKDLRAYVDKTQKFSINRRKLLYLYKLRYDSDPGGAEIEYEKLLAMKDIYPIEGEFRSELGIVEYLRSKYA